MLELGSWLRLFPTWSSQFLRFLVSIFLLSLTLGSSLVHYEMYEFICEEYYQLMMGAQVSLLNLVIGFSELDLE